jgi:hypothetical protein
MTPEQCLQYAANQRLEAYFTYILPVCLIGILLVLTYNKWIKK